jgi:hypothetical protein
MHSRQLRTALLAKAQEELRRDPGCVKLLPDPLTDDEVRTLFELEFSALQQDWRHEYERRDKLMEQLEILIDAIQNLMAPTEPAEY